jgi:hypothetical protein
MLRCGWQCSRHGRRIAGFLIWCLDSGAHFFLHSFSDLRESGGIFATEN